MKQAEALYQLVTQSDEGAKFGQAYGWDMMLEVCTWRGVDCEDGSSVTNLDLTGAGYAGTIPHEFQDLVLLKNLTLKDNKFAGLVPPQVAQLPALEVFDVTNNTLMGPLPIFDKAKSPKLRQIILQHNMFTHHMTTEWIAALPNSLTQLDISMNQIFGSLPTEIASLSNLDTLDVSVNDFYGTIPEELASLPKLKYLYLNVNHFVGTIPRAMASSTNIFEEVWFQNNWLSGTIPPDFAEMPQLLDLYVDGNYFTGTIPPDLCRPSLNADFYKDQYQTNVVSNPDSTTHVQNNNQRDYCQSIACPANHYSIEGIWPCQQCPDTERTPYLGTETKCFPTNEYEILKQFWMDTHGNEWSGSSTWFYDGVAICDFSGVTCDTKGAIAKIVLPYMNLRGTISPELGFLEHLDTLILSDNKLSGYLPTTLQNAPLEILDVTGNHIQGIVPPRMCLMTVNRNGENEEYECDKVACPSGTYHPTGIGPGCGPCQDATVYLGQKQCEKPGHTGGAGFFTNLEESVSNTSGGKVIVGILSFLIIACACYCIGFVAWRRYKEKKGLISQVMEGRRKHQQSSTRRFGKHEKVATSDEQEQYEDDTLTNGGRRVGSQYPSTEMTSTAQYDDRFEANNPELCDVPVLESPKLDTPDFPSIPEMA